MSETFYVVNGGHPVNYPIYIQAMDNVNSTKKLKHKIEVCIFPTVKLLYVEGVVCVGEQQGRSRLATLAFPTLF
jgi:hypothetical protein